MMTMMSKPLSKYATGLDFKYQPKYESFSAEHPRNRYEVWNTPKCVEILAKK